jgi:uncharacterized protein (UPF0248 family)
MTARGRGSTLRDLLNRARWDEHAGAAELTLTVRERRNSHEGTRVVPFVDVVEVLAAGVVTADGTFFPYHRIIALTSARGPLWQAREGNSHGET